MRLRTKITGIFILLTGLFQIVIFIFIYLFAQEYTENRFYLSLKERATIAAQAYLEKDEMNAEIYENIRIRHLQTLTDEREVIYPVDQKKQVPISRFQDDLPESFFKQIFDDGYAELKENEFYYTGILYNDNEGDFIITLSARDVAGIEKLDNLSQILLIAFIVSMIFIFILGQYYAKQALSPIAKIIQKVNAIRAESLSQRLDAVTGKDELADLTYTFNNMLQRLESSFEMKNTFVQNASHELENPLTAIIGQTEVALTHTRSKEEYIATLQAVEIEAYRLNDLINTLFRLAYVDQDSKELLTEYIRTDELMMKLKMGFDTSTSKRMKYNFQSLPENPDKLIFRGNLSLVKVALLNILDNAIKYSSDEKIELDIRIRENTILISVQDKGIGISEKDIQHIFDPFYRGSNARNTKGFGFGLSLSQKIIQLHGGEIKIFSELGNGTTVLIEIPMILHEKLL